MPGTSVKEIHLNKAYEIVPVSTFRSTVVSVVVKPRE
jgi:hypothetical protein